MCVVLFATGALLTVLPLAFLMEAGGLTGGTVGLGAPAISAIQLAVVAIGAGSYYLPLGLPFLKGYGHELFWVISSSVLLVMTVGISAAFSSIDPTVAAANLLTTSIFGLAMLISGTVHWVRGSNRMAADGIVLNSNIDDPVTVTFGGSQLVIRY